MTTRWISCWLVAGITLASCGGSDGGNSAGSATEGSRSSQSTTETEPSTTPAPVTQPSDPSTNPSTTVADTSASTEPVTTEPAPLATEAEAAASALITLADLPPEWTEQPYDPADDADDDEVLALVAECSGLDPALLGDDVLGDTKAKTGEFNSPDESASVQHTIGFAVDDATARAALEAIGDPALPDCYEQALATAFAAEFPDPDPTDTLPAELVLGEVVAEYVDVTGLADPDEAVWLTFLAPLTVSGQTFEQHLDLIFLRTGRVLSQVQLGGLGAPFPPDLIDQIVTLAIERAESIAP